MTTPSEEVSSGLDVLTTFQIDVARAFFALPESREFDRAEARDFADVYVLAARFGREALLRSAAEVDPGFDVEVFAEMLSTLARFRDADVPVAVGEISALRAFFAEWIVELRAPD